MKDKIYQKLEEVKTKFANHFIADDQAPTFARKKQLRLSILIFGLVVMAMIIAYNTGVNLSHKSPSSSAESRESGSMTTKIDINKLAEGVKNETLWIEQASKELDEVKERQKQNESSSIELSKIVNENKVGKTEFEEALKQLEANMDSKYNARLQEEIAKLEKAKEYTGLLEVSPLKAKKQLKLKKIGDYIPAGSYVSARMISGVDAGVGVTAAADPRQVILRITGKAISAGYGKNYLTTDKLMGCILQCKAKGDLSSEKTYLQAVLMTCARSVNEVVEVPIKGYIVSSGKDGIRGEMVSREGHLVAQSFLSGLIGGIGGGVAQTQPGYAISGGVMMQEKEKTKNILYKGLGSGVINSTSMAADYLIKRAEQYHPIISVNEGTEVEVVFQEGFSLEEDAS